MKALLVCCYLFPLNHLSLIVHPTMIIRECVCLFLCVIHVISFLRQSKQCFPSLGHLLFVCVCAIGTMPFCLGYFLWCIQVSVPIITTKVTVATNTFKVHIIKAGLQANGNGCIPHFTPNVIIFLGCYMYF